LANTLWNLGFGEEAKDFFSDAVEMGLEKTALYLDYSDLLFENGQVEESIEFLIESIRKFPEKGRLRYKYVATLLAMGQHQLAQTELTIALQEFPVQSDALFDFYPNAGQHEFVLDLLENHK
jgi:tetratricopeptide (TPR) repeat protein